MGLLTTAQANSIRGSVSEVLRYHERQGSGPSRTVDDQKLANLLRKCPEAGSVLEPLLSKEQIEMMLRGDGDADDGTEAE
jgi:hypothetical protein